MITEDEKPFVQFVEAVWEAEANATITWQQVVHTAASADPDWAWKMLERWYSEELKAPAQRLEHTGADGNDIQHNVSLTDWRKQQGVAQQQVVDAIADFHD